MKIITLYILVLILLLINQVNSQSIGTLTHSQAKHILEDYSHAIQTGNYNQIRTFWSKKIGSNYFASLPIWHELSIDISNSRNLNNIKGQSYEFQKIVFKDKYYEIHSNWQTLKDHPNLGLEDSEKMIHYVIKEGSDWVFMDPAILLTKDWKIHETEIFRFHYPSNLNINNYSNELSYIEAKTKKLLIIFNISLQDKIDYYKVLSFIQGGILASSVGANGLCLRSSDPTFNPVFDKILSTSFTNEHEVVHALTALLGLPDINTVFLEGLPVALGGTTWLTKTYSLTEAWKIMQNQSSPPLETFFNDEGFIENSAIAYHLSGSYVHYILTQYGLKRLLEFYQHYKKGYDLDKSLTKVYGKPFNDLEEDWREYLLKTNRPIVVGYESTNNGEVVSQLSDPVNDDYGPGNYHYPTSDKIPEGICDITHFTMSQDSLKVYFKIKLRKSVRPVYFSDSDESISSAIYIAINRGILAQNQLNIRYASSLVDPKIGFDILITAGFGISITNNVRKRDYISDLTYDSLFDYSSNELNFSISKEFIGMPNKDWQVFIGSGLQSDYGMDITTGAPLTIEQGSSTNYGWAEQTTPFSPHFFDIVLTDDHDQMEVLSKYNYKEGKRPILPMLNLIHQE
jgi:C-terminal binding-module, SLH-like, of glucodextranase